MLGRANCLEQKEREEERERGAVMAALTASTSRICSQYLCWGKKALSPPKWNVSIQVTHCLSVGTRDSAFLLSVGLWCPAPSAPDAQHRRTPAGTVSTTPVHPALVAETGTAVRRPAMLWDRDGQRGRNQWNLCSSSTCVHLRLTLLLASTSSAFFLPHLFSPLISSCFFPHQLFLFHCDNIYQCLTTTSVNMISMWPFAWSQVNTLTHSGTGSLD